MTARRLLASGLTFALGAGLLVASAGPAAAATITVNSLGDTTADDGSCTLREAIDNANDGTPPAPRPDCAAGSGDDTITFSVTGTITLTLGTLPDIDASGGPLTIEGPGANLLTISGADTFGVLIVDPFASLTLGGLTIAHGSATYGAGIYNDGGTLAITNSTLSDNAAGDYGGGIYNYLGSTVTVTNSTLSDNSAGLGGGGISNNGGGIFTITNSTLSGNNAGDNGGGIFIDGGTVTITDSTLWDNSAGDNGGGILNDFGTVTITDSTLWDNSAGFRGGGIFNDGDLTVTDSTLTANTADEGGGIFNGEFFEQCIDCRPDSRPNPPVVFLLGARIFSSTFEGNHAYFDGGGINNQGYLQVVNSTFNANTADGYGGGLYHWSLVLRADPGSLLSSGALAEITNATFSENSALGQGNLVMGSPVAGQAPGGGIFNETGMAIDSAQAGLLVLKGTIVDHSLGDDCSGPIYDGGYNLDSDDSCQLSDENSSLPSTDPDLEPLEDNGGPTETMALNTGSPALDLIPPGVCEHFLGHSPEDQRGVARPQGEGCDIGAFELEPDGTTPPPPPDQRWTEQTAIDLRGPFGTASAVSASLGAERSSFKLKGTLYARHWFCQHNSRVNLILVGQGQIGSTFTNGAGDFAFLTSLPQGEDQASYKARFPQKKGQPGRCKGSVSDPLVVSGG